jgi:di/tricarboxylate transporter
MYTMLIILVVTIVLFVWSKYSPDVVALKSMLSLFLFGILNLSETLSGFSNSTVIMIAVMIPMGIAIQKIGTAELISNSIISFLGKEKPTLLVAEIFLLTTTFSQFINNSATAVVMAPIALLAAEALQISAEPLLITIAISASTAFLTPFGTTTNAMVMNAGNYKFLDYLKVGFPLLSLFLITTLILVPIIWPF